MTSLHKTICGAILSQSCVVPTIHARSRCHGSTLWQLLCTTNEAEMEAQFIHVCCGLLSSIAMHVIYQEGMEALRPWKLYSFGTIHKGSSRSRSEYHTSPANKFCKLWTKQSRPVCIHYKNIHGLMSRSSRGNVSMNVCSHEVVQLRENNSLVNSHSHDSECRAQRFLNENVLVLMSRLAALSIFWLSTTWAWQLTLSVTMLLATALKP